MQDAGVNVTVLYVEGCPHIALAVERVTAAFERLRIDVPLDLKLVDGEEQAAALGFGGSPTVLVDGRDPFPNAPAGLSCRLYATEKGMQGAPSIAQLVEALRR
jgi:hypothetical protein